MYNGKLKNHWQGSLWVWFRRKYIDIYKNQIEELLFKPYNGTLNLQISIKDYNQLDKIANCIVIKCPSKEYGAIKCYAAKICNLDCAILIPEKTKHKEVIEVISPYYLREKLNIFDSDNVTVVVTYEYKQL